MATEVGNGQSSAVRTGTSAAVGGAVVGLPRQQALAGRIGGQGRGQTDPSPGGVGGEHASGARLIVADSRRDRKSTRLNSSHVAISYAVFCLIKKIIIRRMI